MGAEFVVGDATIENLVGFSSIAATARLSLNPCLGDHAYHQRPKQRRHHRLRNPSRDTFLAAFGHVENQAPDFIYYRGDYALFLACRGPAGQPSSYVRIDARMPCNVLTCGG